MISRRIASLCLATGLVLSAMHTPSYAEVRARFDKVAAATRLQPMRPLGEIQPLQIGVQVEVVGLPADANASKLLQDFVDHIKRSDSYLFAAGWSKNENVVEAMADKSAESRT